MQQNQTIFANFILKFGEANMLDYAEQVVLPAFTDDTLIRGYGQSSMHFYDVRLIMADGEAAVAGQFIHNAVLKRTHRFVPGVGQVEDEGTLETSPSAFFVLLLANHRLIYFAETSHAPELSTFQNTIKKFLDTKYEQFIRAERKRVSAPGARVTKAMMYERIKKPTLEIVPLSGRASIRDFVGSYEKLQSIKIVVLRRNDDVDPAKTMEELDQLAKAASAPNATVSMTNGGGLNPEGVIKIIEGVAPQGNQEVTVKGIGQDGQPLKGSNDDFSVKPSIDHVPPGLAARASFLVIKMKEFLRRGIVSAPNGSADSRQKAAALVERQ